MKKEYCVRIVVTEYYRVFVEAEDYEEAEKLAEEMLASGELYESHRRMDIEAERTYTDIEDDE